VEEAQTISQQSMDVLHPTVRKIDSEVWYSFNPRLATDPVFKFFVGDEENPTHPPSAMVRLVGHQDNPWLSPAIVEEIATLYKNDPDKAAWVWGGRTVKVTEAQVLRGRWRVEDFKPKAEWSGPHYGLDFGFAVSPTAAVEVYIDGDTLYVHNEVSGTNIDTVDLPTRLKEIPLLVENVCRADCSRPETISHLRRHGFPRVLACYKGKGSIEGGLEHLRSYKHIVIHPRCELAQEQALLYSFKRDTLTDEVKKPAVPEDKHDDIWDAVRYALEPIILRGKPPKTEDPPPVPPMDYRAQRVIAMRQRRG
jgi:phage terminase large subunit